MRLDQIKVLRENTQGPCLSITIPIDPIEKKKNYEVLKKMIQKVKSLLSAKAIGHDIQSKILIELERVGTRLPENLSKGLGIFISPESSITISFPFEVKTKAVVENAFELRDLLYLQQYGIPYFVLNLSKKGVHLFKGSLNELKEVNDGTFPLQYEDQFEYERASVANGSSSSLKNFERDKNEISEIRLKAVFRQADALLKARLKAGIKVLLAGTQRMISLFNSVTSLKNVAGKVSGSFNENNLDKLRELSWTAIVRARKSEIEKQVKDLQEKNGHVAEGLQQVWNAAVEGKGLVLLVEKDLHHRAYRKEHESELHLQPPRKPYTVIPDVIDELIKTVQSKNGKVLFTENDQLKSFERVALVLRY